MRCRVMRYPHWYQGLEGQTETPSCVQTAHPRAAVLRSLKLCWLQTLARLAAAQRHPSAACAAICTQRDTISSRFLFQKPVKALASAAPSVLPRCRPFVFSRLQIRAESRQKLLGAKGTAVQRSQPESLQPWVHLQVPSPSVPTTLSFNSTLNFPFATKYISCPMSP
ncbi:hypothetical protein BC830DRAFT_718016 [Chytriomyces sp. MP71]|nr:hypothetical protein BC830DRAFT_718016 [Chytriomyces sp. MP71]